MKPLLHPRRTPLIGYICSLALFLFVPPALAQNFGGSVALSDGDIIIGETGNQANSGSVYVYRRGANGEWAEVGTLAASDADGGDDRFGRALAIEGNTLVVGATTKDNRKGAGYIFEKDASGMWQETMKLSPGDLVEGDHLGRSVAVGGDVVLIGSAGRAENAGVVYVYRRDASGTWTEEAQLTGSDSEAGDYYGLAVAVHGDVAFVGTPVKNANTGAVYVYRYDEAAGSWQEETKLETQMIGENDNFGNALAINQDQVLVGAPGFGQNIGAAFAFKYNEESGTWQQQAVLLPYDVGPDEGSALARLDVLEVEDLEDLAVDLYVGAVLELIGGNHGPERRR
jgi:hypothetical protein